MKENQKVVITRSITSLLSALDNFQSQWEEKKSQVEHQRFLRGEWKKAKKHFDSLTQHVDGYLGSFEDEDQTTPDFPKEVWKD